MIDASEIGAELRRRCARPYGAVDVAARALDVLFELEEQGRRLFPLARAYVLAGNEARLHATRGELAEWNDPAASAGDPILAAKWLDHVPSRDLVIADATASGIADPRFVRAWEIASIVTLTEPIADGQRIVILAFARRAIDAMAARSFALFARAVDVALVDADETVATVDSAERAKGKQRALEALCEAHEAHAAEVTRRARETTERAEQETRRRVDERVREMQTESAKAKRAHRAFLNVIDDLREARAQLESRVEERTKQIEELLERERRARFDAEEARAQAETANRLKDEFLTTVSHELRTPLNAMMGWASLLRDERLDESKRVNAILTIERNARTQVRLIDDLLDLGRILQGKFRLALGPVEVVPLVEAALESVRPSAEAKGVRLQRALDSHATILGDGERIQQIAWNLLSNAIKFTPRGGRVLVTLRRAPSYVELVVADTGSGIAPEFLPHVFEPFRQADGALSRRTGGLGLGLSIVHSLVELHGGTVTASSDGQGQGATFAVRIPMAPVRASSPDLTSKARNPRAEPAAPTFECPPELARLRILVIDDERDTRELMGFILGECGAEVYQAGSADEAISALDSHVVDVVVSDIGLPGEDGLSLIRRIRARSPESGGAAPAIALTAYARTEDRAQALKAGFDVHLAKPVDPTELTLVIAAAVRGGRR